MNSLNECNICVLEWGGKQYSTIFQDKNYAQADTKLNGETEFDSVFLTNLIVKS